MALMVTLGVVGLVLLSVAADQLVIGASRLADRIGVPPVVVGIVVIGFGTSTPELLVSGAAARQGHTGLAVGNLTGSNILNLTLVLGVAGVVAPLTVRSSVIRREAPLAAGGVTMFAVALEAGLGTTAGLVLSVSLVATVVLLVRTSRRRPGDPLRAEALTFVDGTDPHGLVRESARAVLGLAGTLAGAQLVVTNAAGVAAHLGVSQQVIGLTLVALGTSLPELVTSIQAQRRGVSDLVVGNLLGSSLFNSLGGGAVIAFAGRGGTAPASTSVTVLMVAVTGITWFLLARGHRLTRGEAAILVLLYGLAVPLLT